MRLPSRFFRAAVLLVMLLLPAAALADDSPPPPDTTVTARGTGADSRAALLDAKRAAVEAGAGVLIQSETEVRNFTVERDKILSRTMGAIRSFTVVSEKKTDDGVTEVTISAVVSLADINREMAALRILFETMEKPRVMVLVEENIGGGRSAVFQTEFVKKLLEYGFNMVDTATVAALMDRGDAVVRRALAGDLASAVMVGTQNGAEVIIIGKVTASRGPEVYGMTSGQADVTLSAISCSTGQVLASGTAHGAAVHVNLDAALSDAFKKAAARIMERKKEGKYFTSFFDTLVAAWQNMANNGQAIAVTVENVRDFKTASAVKSALENAGPDVVSVVQRSYQKPRASFEVTWKGPADYLAQSLDGKELPGLGTLKVSALTAGAITLEVSAPDPCPPQPPPAPAPAPAQ